MHSQGQQARLRVEPGTAAAAGYVITATILAMMLTSLPSMRRFTKWSFEVFYISHVHLVLVLYAVTIIHTIDGIVSRLPRLS